MIKQLAKGASTIGELGEPFDMTKPAITKHVKVLESTGLLTREVDGRVHRVEIDPRPLDAAQRWVEEVREFWEGRLDDLAGYLDGLQKKGKGKRRG